MTVFDPKTLIGMSIIEARKTYPYINIRQVIIDGVEVDVTFEECPTRINVETKNGTIIGIDGFY